MSGPFDALALGLPQNPIELISLVLVIDAVAMAALAAVALWREHRTRHAH